MSLLDRFVEVYPREPEELIAHTMQDVLSACVIFESLLLHMTARSERDRIGVLLETLQDEICRVIRISRG